MRYFIVSDLHGSDYYLGKALEAFDREGADRMIILGDMLYHGPRNSLPEGYDPKRFVARLNDFASRKTVPLCVRGNCDAEVDQMMFGFPIMADYIAVSDGNDVVYATHGHVYNEKNPLPFVVSRTDNGKEEKPPVLLCGHTHIPALKDCGTFIYMNPGSASLPKNDTWHGYMIWEEGRFCWKDMDGNIRMEYYDDGGPQS